MIRSSLLPHTARCKRAAWLRPGLVAATLLRWGWLVVLGRVTELLVPTLPWAGGRTWSPGMFHRTCSLSCPMEVPHFLPSSWPEKVSHLCARVCTFSFISCASGSWRSWLTSKRLRKKPLAWEPPREWNSNPTNPCLAEQRRSLPPPRAQGSLSRDGLGTEPEPGQEGLAG